METLWSYRDAPWYLLHLHQLTACVLIIAQVLLIAHKYYGYTGAEMLHFRGPCHWMIFWKSDNIRGHVISGRGEKMTLMIVHSVGRKWPECLRKWPGLLTAQHVSITSVSGEERGRVCSQIQWSRRPQETDLCWRRLRDMSSRRHQLSLGHHIIQQVPVIGTLTIPYISISW